MLDWGQNVSLQMYTILEIQMEISTWQQVKMESSESTKSV